MRIFLDANIFVAAVGNEKGGSAYLFSVAQYEGWTLVTTFFALSEARRNVTKKLSGKERLFSNFLIHPSVLVTSEAPVMLQKQCSDIVPTKDIPILASALFSQCNTLCTLDVKDFHSKRVISFCAKYGMDIQTPGDILMQYRKKKTS